MKAPLVLAGIVLVCFATGSQSADIPATLVWDGTHLAKMRERVHEHPEAFATALETLRSDAEQAFDAGPWSVTDDPAVPPSGDVHDYSSVGPYWWPDPSKPDGLPYIRRDGEVNPDRYQDDSERMDMMSDAVQELSLAWFFLREPKYAERAAKLLRVWFLDPPTKMNPNLQFGQSIPGRTEGRGIGIIDTAQLISLIDAVELLRSSDAWTESDHQRLQHWFDRYLTWLLESKHGRDEANTKNNHATWYDAQVASFALFADKPQIAKRILEQVGPRRIATQIDPEGRMPHELARTKSFSYTTMNTRGLLTLARLAEHVDVDLWNFQSNQGSSIEAALDWLLPFVTGQAEWKHPQISEINHNKATDLYRRAWQRIANPSYRRLTVNNTDPLSILLGATNN